MILSLNWVWGITQLVAGFSPASAHFSASLSQEDDDLTGSLAEYSTLMPRGFHRKRFPRFSLIIKLVYRVEYIHGIAKNKKGNKEYQLGYED